MKIPSKAPLCACACIFALSAMFPFTVNNPEPELTLIFLAVVMLIPVDPVKLLVP